MEKVTQLLQGSRKEGNYFYGFVDGEENLEVLLEKFRQISGVYFPTEHKRARATDSGAHFSEVRPLFSLKGKNINIEFCGTPFTSEGTTNKTCMFGRDTKAKAKEKNKNNTQSQPLVYNEHGYNLTSIKKKPRHQVTKKKIARLSLLSRRYICIQSFPLILNST